MSDIEKELLALREELDEFEAGLGSETVSTGALEDFKVAVDDVRTSLLSMLVVDDSRDYRSFLRKYRLRRAAQVCQGVLSGLADGTLDRQTPGLDRLRASVIETLAFLEGHEAAAHHQAAGVTHPTSVTPLRNLDRSSW